MLCGFSKNGYGGQIICMAGRSGGGENLHKPVIKIEQGGV